MVRKHKFVNSSLAKKIEKQVQLQDSNSVRSKNQPSWSPNIMSPPSVCHGSESCGCFCHYAEDDPPPCYTCCEDPGRSDDYSLAHKVLNGKRDSLSKGTSNHLSDYVLRDEFGIEIPKYRKKKNKKALNSAKVIDDESSPTLDFGAKDSLRLNREYSLNLLNEKLLQAANDYVSRDEFGNEIPKYRNKYYKKALNSAGESVNYRLPSQCRQQQLGKTKQHYVMRDNFGLQVKNNSAHKGCTVS